MRYLNDPYWITAKFPGRCSSAKCQATIPRDGRAFYYPRGKFLLCRSCGEAADREFAAAVMDEEFYCA